MCSSEFTFKWQSLTVDDLTKIKTLFFIFLLLNVPLCSPSEEKTDPSKQINIFKSVGHKSCYQEFKSPSSGSKQGTFRAPLFTHEKNLTEHSHSCIFMFIAQPNEQVSISFSSFKLRSSPPDCKHEFVDFYTELNNEDLDLKQANLSSRNCGSQLPKKRVSLKQKLAFVYHNDLNASNDTHPVFEGSYEFIKAEPFTLINSTNDECNFEINYEQQRDGTLQSPTYPGIYSIPLNCTYKFKGQSGNRQRIKIVFHDIDIFSGGAHCPFDYLKIWDGETMNSSLIGTYCGQRRTFTVFSTKHTLLMQFKTTKRFSKAQNRGFSAWFEFSDRLVGLDFIEKNNGELILGTECDQRISSKGEQHSNSLVSPNYGIDKYPSSTQCTYYLYGLNDKFNLQKVRIQFEIFDLPNNDSSNECLESSLSVYTSDPPNEDPDYVYCGKESPPNNLVSDGSTMILVFKTKSNLQQAGKGFSLQYTFETDYRIDGTIQPPGCNFIYKSEVGRKSSLFNSPRYPSSYPAQTTCTYRFIPLEDELVSIMFQNFRLQKEHRLSSQNVPFKDYESNSSLDIYNGYGDEACNQDWLEIHELSNTKSDGYSTENNFNSLRKARSNAIKLKDQKLFSLDFDNLIEDQIDIEKVLNSQTKLGRWCSYSSPGPIITSKPGNSLKIVFQSDLTGFASGFLGTYTFRKKLNSHEKCDYHLGSESVNLTSSKLNVIVSPNWPQPYKSVDKWCNWIIKVRKGFRVHLQFQLFSIEGDMKTKGCPKTVVRIWKSKSSQSIDLCGGALTNSTRNILSDDNYMRISFISSTKSIGAGGFKAVWSEIGY